MIRFLLPLFLPTLAAAQTVISIADGDTLTVLHEQKQIRVRLAEIDAPERKQPFGTRSRQSLAEICYRKEAKLTSTRTDRFGRTVARVHCNGMDANAEQVRRGMAWVYDRYASDVNLMVLQAEAREERRGLWADKEPIKPWGWRRQRKSD